MPSLLKIEDATLKLREVVSPLQTSVQIPIADSVNRVVAEPIKAPIDLPPFDSSAMDGYAVSLDEDLPNGGDFRLVGESLAGHPFQGNTSPGDAVRIFTGAEVPLQMNTVIIQEDVIHKDRSSIKTTEVLKQGANVRRAGQDISKGALLFDQGVRLSSYHVSWLAACGIEHVQVRPSLRVAIFSTGDELVQPGNALGPGQIYDSNRFALIRFLEHTDAQITVKDHLADNLQDTVEALRHAATQADLIITTGGVSVGDADFVKPALEALGTLSFWNIALKPGKPLAVGTIGDTTFIGLPGNPVSTIVTYLLFVVPILDLLQGTESKPHLVLSARLQHRMRHSIGRREYQRGRFYARGDALEVIGVADQSSNRLSSFKDANCLIVVPEDRADLETGEVVQVIPLGRTMHQLATF